ncbi:MAG: hypothetical protein ACYCT6_08955 [bacterium]
MQENTAQLNLRGQDNEYIHVLKNGEKGIIAELTSLSIDGERLCKMAHSYLIGIENATIQFIAYVSPEKNEQRYFVTLTVPDIYGKEDNNYIEIFKGVIWIHTKNKSCFLDENSLNALNDLFAAGHWRGISLPQIQKKRNYRKITWEASYKEKLKEFSGAVDCFLSDKRSYSNNSAEPTLWTLNLSNKKAAKNDTLGHKLQRFLNGPVYYNYKHRDFNDDYGISVSMGFFKQISQDMSSCHEPKKSKDFELYLPFGYDARKYYKDVYRLGSMTEFSARIFPSIEWRGTQNKTIPVLMKNGVKTGFNMFDLDYVGNGFIAGRDIENSALIKHIAYSHFLGGGGVFLFPNKEIDAYKGLISKTGGQIITLDINNPVSVNPFSLIKTWDELINAEYELINFIYVLGNDNALKKSAVDKNNTDILLDKNENDEKLIKSYIEEAIRKVCPEYKENALVAMIAEYLKLSPDSRVKDFGKRISVLMEGPAGKFFSGKSAVSFKNPFVLIDMSGINTFSHSELYAALFCSVAMHITDCVRLDHKKDTLTFIDGGSDLLGICPEIVNAVEGLYRQRKFALGTITALEDGMNGYSYSSYQKELVRETLSPVIYHSAWKFFTHIAAGFEYLYDLGIISKKNDEYSSCVVDYDELLIAHDEFLIKNPFCEEAAVVRIVPYRGI